jgi:SAM-dependent methyltransferase
LLKNEAEYRQMFETETSLWWYKILHKKVLDYISQYFNTKEITILDAGCGTGGLMTFLINNGYKNIKGFDYSIDAVKYCKKRNLEVSLADITKLEAKTIEKFDLIICNDVLYQFENNEIISIFENLFARLKPDGKIISNNQAFNMFRGTHDIAVGSKQRFTIGDFEKLLHQNKIGTIITANYWSFLLSPLIFLVRFVQRLKLRFGLIDVNKVKSDVELPSEFINNLFYSIVKFEHQMIKKAPLGSSIIFVAKKGT